MIRRRNQRYGLVEDVIRTHQRISIIINNAGVSISAPFEKVGVEDFKRLFATNFWGAIHLCHHSLPFLKAEPEARIVNVLSTFALLGFPSKTAYCSSKSALLGFSNALYAELYKTGVRVSVVIPPAVNTNLIKSGMAYDEIKKQREQDFVARRGIRVDLVTRKIIEGMIRGKFKIRIGLTVRVVDLMSRYFPTATHTLLARNKSRIGFL